MHTHTHTHTYVYVYFSFTNTGLWYTKYIDIPPLYFNIDSTIGSILLWPNKIYSCLSLKGFAEIKLSSLLTLHFLLEFPCHMYKLSLSSLTSLFLLAFFRKQTSLWECHSPYRVFDWFLFLFSFFFLQIHVLCSSYSTLAIPDYE